MRHLIVTIILLITGFVYSGAQVRVDSGATEVEMKVKRAFSRGNDVCIDLIVTGLSSWESIAFWVIERKIYDDEGNFYERNQIYFEADGEMKNVIPIERGIARKVRIVVKDVDEYASSFTLIKLHYDGNNTSANPRMLTIRDLPITR